MNNKVEQDHRLIKRRFKPNVGFFLSEISSNISATESLAIILNSSNREIVDTMKLTTTEHHTIPFFGCLLTSLHMAIIKTAFGQCNISFCWAGILKKQGGDK